MHNLRGGQRGCENGLTVPFDGVPSSTRSCRTQLHKTPSNRRYKQSRLERSCPHEALQIPGEKTRKFPQREGERGECLGKSEALLTRPGCSKALLTEVTVEPTAVSPSVYSACRGPAAPLSTFQKGSHLIPVQAWEANLISPILQRRKTEAQGSKGRVRTPEVGWPSGTRQPAGLPMRSDEVR